MTNSTTFQYAYMCRLFCWHWRYTDDALFRVWVISEPAKSDWTGDWTCGYRTELEDNARRYLSNIVGVPSTLRQQLIINIFCSKSLVSYTDIVTLDNAVAQFQHESLTNVSTKFIIEYFNTQLQPTLRDNMLVGHNCWTNNNCERINDVLKATTQWRRSKLPDFIDRVRELTNA